jgi:hypothetical protein
MDGDFAHRPQSPEQDMVLPMTHVPARTAQPPSPPVFVVAGPR